MAVLEEGGDSTQKSEGEGKKEEGEGKGKGKGNLKGYQRVKSERVKSKRVKSENFSGTVSIPMPTLSGELTYLRSCAYGGLFGLS